MNTDEHRSDGPHAEVTFAIIGGAMEVLNGLGHGLNEKPYENALLIELGQRQLKVDQQKRCEVVYKGVVVGDYIPDLIVGDERDCFVRVCDVKAFLCRVHCERVWLLAERNEFDDAVVLNDREILGLGVQRVEFIAERNDGVRITTAAWQIAERDAFTQTERGRRGYWRAG